ncbi:MAG: SPFH domain-containing protein, partial [Firmicutes bacterium]|nr:SPFH domain-containing protein [Candidatus Colimorpha enterica]
MENKTITNKNGMAVLIIEILLLIAAFAGLIFFAIRLDTAPGVLNIVGIIISGLILTVGWLPLLGLKVIKPQEALVLTLFGKYYGTLATDGFYCVNPFCTAVNPAAATKLNQSGDVNSEKSPLALAITQNGVGVQAEALVSKKISLKIMTLNNS